jgi:hypothetical protein
VPIDSARAARVDDYVRLDGKITAFKPILNEHRAAREEILGWYPELLGSESVTAPGALFDVLVTARDNERSVTPLGKRKLSKMLGLPEFFRRCAFPLKHLPDPTDPYSLFSEQLRTGPRHLKPVPKPLLRAA